MHDVSPSVAEPSQEMSPSVTKPNQEVPGSEPPSMTELSKDESPSMDKPSQKMSPSGQYSQARSGGWAKPRCVPQWSQAEQWYVPKCGWAKPGYVPKEICARCALSVTKAPAGEEMLMLWRVGSISYICLNTLVLFYNNTRNSKEKLAYEGQELRLLVAIQCFICKQEWDGTIVFNLVVHNGMQYCETIFSQI